MTPFSTLLSSYIKAKEIRIYPFAQYCNVDRSNMYKLINGKRNPASEKTVHKMADFMRLSPSERKELLEAYHISITGYDNYYRRKNVQEFIVHFSNFQDARSGFSHDFTPTFNLSGQDSVFSVSGVMELNHTVSSILSSEAQKEQGLVRLIVQPEFDFYMDVLSYVSKNEPGLTIEHIFCLNNNDSITADKRDYNLSCLQKIIPMYCKCRCSYTPYYYYDSITTHNSHFNLMSSLIITSDYALTFSPQLQYGIVFTKPDIIREFRNIFDQLKTETTPAVCKFDSVFIQFKYFNSQCTEEERGISFQKEPCLIPLFSTALVEKYVRPELLASGSFIQTVNQYILEKAEAIKTQSLRFIFSEEGIVNFLKTGRIFELPDQIYKPLEYQDRVFLIRNMMHMCRIDKYMMLRPNTPVSDSNLCLHVTAHNGYLLFRSSDGNLVYLNLEEPSLRLAFYDYFSSLDEEMFYSSSETLERITALLKHRP